ncbi:HU family DNA-binding protein [Sphingobium aromaticiconvertens]|uniref:HU family DNA-binding protein n=1 Tax=Sphingobium aromaticiconvertens TaxID=365341 RepID=UPI0030161356
MNSSELIDAVASATGTTKADAKKIIDATFGAIGDAGKGEEVAVNGFGKFKLKLNGAREGKNPRTGEPLSIPASKGLGFSAAKTVKDKLNG